ncbi:MAG: hypothetical protein OXC91_14550 [Rhodobacteraceae bacterium]|nr:hypothetical protein [Paracoccaceae bacterium]
MEFYVQRYSGADNPINNGKYEKVIAASAKEAAEKACGESLFEGGHLAHLRAVVKTVSLQSCALSFFALP